jgi:hypothetical protein
LAPAIEQADGMPPPASTLPPSANVAGYRGKRRRVEWASSWRCVHRERLVSASFIAKPYPRVRAVRATTGSELERHQSPPATDGPEYPRLIVAPSI